MFQTVAREAKQSRKKREGTRHRYCLRMISHVCKNTSPRTTAILLVLESIELLFHIHVLHRNAMHFICNPR